MTKPQTDTVILVEDASAVSKKRQVAAVVTATAATVLLTVAANVAISQISTLVQRRINPPKTETEETE